MDIVEGLASTEKKVIEVFEEWWDIYKTDHRMALKELVLILYHSGGIKVGSFTINEFPNLEIKEQIFSSKSVLNAPILILLYRRRLLKFLDHLLCIDFWAILKNESFMVPLITVIDYIKQSPWDPIRSVSFLCGMKILRHSYKYCKQVLVSHTNRTALSRRIESWITKLHTNFFKYSMRDKMGHLRSIPLIELVSWSKENPEDMIEDNFFKYVVRGLRDSSIENCKLSLKIIINIFMKPLIVEKQEKLLKSVIPFLVTFLRSNEECGVSSLKLINRALGFLDVTINANDDLQFSMCLYDDRECIVEEAKLYFYNLHFKEKSGVEIIVETMKFHKESPVKCISKLVSCLIKYLVAYTSWRDWEYWLNTCTGNSTKDYLNLLYEYFHLLNTESSDSIQELDSSRALKMLDAFSLHFSKCWIQLIDSDDVLSNIEAQIYLLKLVSLFNVSKLFKQTRADLISKLVTMFHRSQNYEVLKECLLSIKFLNSFNTSVEIEENIKLQIRNEFSEVLCSSNEEAELLNVSYYKMIVVIKYLYLSLDDLDYLWLHHSNFVLSSQCNQKIELEYSVLYHVLLCFIKKIIEFRSNPNEYNKKNKGFNEFIFTSCLHNRSYFLVEAATTFFKNLKINEPINLLSILVIPRLFGELIYLSKNAFLSNIMYKIKDNEIENYVIFCSQVMMIDCKKNGSSWNPCCSMMKHYADFTIKGNLGVSYLKYFVMKFKQVNTHSLIIMDIFNYLIQVYHNPIGAVVIGNALVTLVNEKKEKHFNDKDIAVNLKEIIIFFLENLKDSERRHYQQTGLLLYSLLKKLTVEGHTIFLEILEIVKSTLFEDIRKKLAEENYTFH